MAEGTAASETDLQTSLVSPPHKGQRAPAIAAGEAEIRSHQARSSSVETHSWGNLTHTAAPQVAVGGLCPCQAPCLVTCPRVTTWWRLGDTQGCGTDRLPPRLLHRPPAPDPSRNSSLERPETASGRACVCWPSGSAPDTGLHHTLVWSPHFYDDHPGTTSTLPGLAACRAPCGPTGRHTFAHFKSC